MLYTGANNPRNIGFSQNKYIFKIITIFFFLIISDEQKWYFSFKYTHIALSEIYYIKTNIKAIFEAQNFEITYVIKYFIRHLYNILKSFDFKYFLIICYQLQKTQINIYIYIFLLCLELLFFFFLLLFNRKEVGKINIFNIAESKFRIVKICSNIRLFWYSYQFYDHKFINFS